MLASSRFGSLPYLAELSILGFFGFLPTPTFSITKVSLRAAFPPETWRGRVSGCPCFFNLRALFKPECYGENAVFLCVSEISSWILWSFVSKVLKLQTFNMLRCVFLKMC